MLEELKRINPSIAEGTLKTLLRHLWYLSEELSACAFFDPRVSFEERRLMADFLTKNSKHLFTAYIISIPFSKKGPS